MTANPGYFFLAGSFPAGAVFVGFLVVVALAFGFLMVDKSASIFCFFLLAMYVKIVSILVLISCNSASTSMSAMAVFAIVSVVNMRTIPGVGSRVYYKVQLVF